MWVTGVQTCALPIFFRSHTDRGTPPVMFRLAKDIPVTAPAAPSSQATPVQLLQWSAWTARSHEASCGGFPHSFLMARRVAWSPEVGWGWEVDWAASRRTPRRSRRGEG